MLSPFAALKVKPVCKPGALVCESQKTSRKPPAEIFVPAGKTNFRALESLERLQPARLTALLLALANSIQSGVVPPLVRTELFCAMISLICTAPADGVAESVPGVPPAILLETALACQLAGSFGSPFRSLISKDEPWCASGQPLVGAGEYVTEITVFPDGSASATVSPLFERWPE